MAAPLLLLQNIQLTLGRSKLLDGAELSVGLGERLCLVGRNGSGKSTLLKIGAGLLEPDGGTRFLQPGVTVRYLPQEPVLSGFATTRAYVEAGLAPGDDPNRAYYLLGKLGLTGDEDTAVLSVGEARRAALARALAPSPDILLLDEPTNHLDLPAIEWLESELRGMRSALVLISHDRRFLENLGRAIVWLDRGITRRVERRFSDYEAWRDEVLEQEERERHKLDRKIAMELDWVRYGVTARRKRNQRRMAELRALRRERREQRQSAGNVKLAAAEANASGSCVIEAVHMSKSYGAGPVVQDFSIRILRRDRVGIVGPNGAGKTTLLNLLTGRLQPDSGDVKLGTNLATASLDQTRTLLDPAMTLSDVLTGGSGDIVHVGGQARHVMSYMKDFLFEPEQARTPVSVLSGGERARLLIAKALATPSNLLVLDEPTNDLDLETLDLLEEMVADYPGTALIVSHDRDFLDRVVTSVLMAEGQGRFVEYAGGYSDMVAQRGEGVAAKESVKATPRNAPPKERKEPAQSRRKLSFSEKHALETLPGRIAGLTADLAALQAQLADPALYARDAKRFMALTAKLTEAEAEKSAAETRWLELEMLREEIEGG
ncbi:MAG TPA: ATP-binding cassette domain-containing protein [Micropepsaceae bacterium]|jgi:ATP-binding cassette subfamily F protein uup|nr:ATP-binding cassette domain-containing protein [Micropepsaceae bacterium]